jgi:hypothetical protein
MAEFPAYPVLPDWIASAIGSSSYRDRTASPLRAEPELLALPTHVLVDLIAFMKCEDVLKLRLASSQAKRFIEETIPSIYARMRKINPIMPVIKFLQAEPGETAVQRTRRAKKNVLLFRNECMLADKTFEESWPFLPLSHPLRAHSTALAAVNNLTMPARDRTVPTLEDPATYDEAPRTFQQMWWEYLIYLKNGLKHEDAYLAVGYKLPLDLAKQLQVASSGAKDKFWASLNRYRKFYQNYGIQLVSSMGLTNSMIYTFEEASRVYSLTGVANSGKALDVYDPQMTAGKILASIRLELMTTGEMQEFLREKKVPGRSKLLRKEDRKAAIAKWISENIL